MRHAVRLGTLAGWCAHQFPHRPEPIGAAGGTRSPPRRSGTRQLLQEDAVGAGARVSQDVPQSQRFATLESLARVPRDLRSEEGKRAILLSSLT